MKIAVFSTKPFDRQFLAEAFAGSSHELVYFEARLADEPSAGLAAGCSAVCVFVNDDLTSGVLATLAGQGVRLIALRSAGFNNVDLQAAEALGLTVSRVPHYSPHAVAEHAVALILTLNRKLHRAYARVREGNFALDGLLGFDLYGRTVGVVGTGEIGLCFARIMAGFGCQLLGFDPFPRQEASDLGLRYVDFPELLRNSDIISLHCPLTSETRHLIDDEALALTRHGVMLINTSRGAVVDTRTLIDALKSGQLGGVGLDVYEEEAELFFRDLSRDIIQDDVFARLLTFPNVVITGHQGFFTREALQAIAQTTLENIDAFAGGRLSGNRIQLP